MSRSTIFTQQPAKCFTGDDKPMRPVRASHLVTYSTFFTDNADHSLDRPFTNKLIQEKKRQSHIQHNRQSDHEDTHNQRKKAHDLSGRTQASSYNLISFDPAYQESYKPPQITRQPEKQVSCLNTVGQPITQPNNRACRKNYPERASSEGIRSAFTYH